MKYREVRLHCKLRKIQIPREEIIDFALDLLGRLRLEGELGIQICSGRRMAFFNRQYRNKTGATNVLAFQNGETYPDGRVYLGDILIAAQVAMKSAEKLGDSLVNELKRLVLHGVLHLAGYDHEQDSGTMARKEKNLRKELGLS